MTPLDHNDDIADALVAAELLDRPPQDRLAREQCVLLRNRASEALAGSGSHDQGSDGLAHGPKLDGTRIAGQIFALAT